MLNGIFVCLTATAPGREVSSVARYELLLCPLSSPD